MNMIATDRPKIHIKRAVIEVHGGCNYKCNMCPQGSEEGREKEFLKKMSFDDFKMVLDQMEGVEVVNLDGSGEATLNKNLPLFIAELTKRKIKSYIYSNGFKFRGQFMKDCIDAGLSLFRFSVIGHDYIQYEKTMRSKNFDIVKQNAKSSVDYVKQTKSDCIIASYHLITTENEDLEVALYRKNFIDAVGTQAEIWRMHNWSGNHDAPERHGKKKTCGRPFAPDLVVRAGGINGEHLAVAPCCQTLGSDVASVLGHLSNQSLSEVWNGEKYEELRTLHREERFDEISYCKNCDFLIDDPEVLVWSNSDLVNKYQMKGVSFSLDEFRD